MASLEPAVHAELLAVQSALSALVATVKKLTSGALPQPPSTTRSASRRRRRQATLCKLYVASQRRSAELVDKEVQTPSLDIAQPDVVEVLVVDMSICLVDLDLVNLLSYDLSLSALRAPLRSSVVEDQVSFVACKDELSQLGNWAVAKMRAAHFEARKCVTAPYV